MNSLWQHTAKRPWFGYLDKDISTDVLIIGGGITGILCAYMLEADGVDYVLTEAENICSGITKNTTAKITVQHRLIYEKLIRKYGIEKAEMYLKANLAALDKYEQLCKNIDCDFVKKDSYVYSMYDRKKIEDEVEALSKLKYNAEFTDKTELPFPIAGALKIKNQAQFNPLCFLYSISEKLNIYERTAVRELIDTTAKTDHGKIKADKIIVATHFPFLNKHGSYFVKMYQERSYVIALNNAMNINGMYVDESENGMSFRNYRDMLLIGGGSHRTGKQGGAWKELRDFAQTYYPKAREKYHWATQDCMTLDNIPYIGNYSAGTNNLFVATGFNKWGMTSAMVSAMILCDMVQEKKNPYAEVFSPSRSILQPQLAVNAFQAIVSLLTPAARRCPHLGCALKWNPNEHTWDCPCHGSRFTKDGKLIDNPSTGGLKR